jgi:hypothetical protein
VTPGEAMGMWHVYPTSDLTEHDMARDGCVCIPRIEAVKRDDGSIGWLAVHHSLDGRERNEL